MSIESFLLKVLQLDTSVTTGVEREILSRHPDIQARHESLLDQLSFQTKSSSLEGIAAIKTRYVAGLFSEAIQLPDRSGSDHANTSGSIVAYLLLSKIADCFPEECWQAFTQILNDLNYDKPAENAFTNIKKGRLGALLDKLERHDVKRGKEFKKSFAPIFAIADNGANS